MLYVGIDDTDNLNSIGTGHLARLMAEFVSTAHPVVGIVRHQLLQDDRIPYTAKNSSASILVEADDFVLDPLFTALQDFMHAHYQTGSDPGLCVATHVPSPVMAFGQRAKVDVVGRMEAQALAQVHHIRLIGLGGTEDGIIGALASVGLAAEGNDGRYIKVGHSRTLAGEITISAIHAAGIEAVRLLDGTPVSEGIVYARRLRPSRRAGKPVLFVEPEDDYYTALKLD